jgi:hypothetical protein
VAFPPLFIEEWDKFRFLIVREIQNKIRKKDNIVIYKIKNPSWYIEKSINKFGNTYISIFISIKIKYLVNINA